MNERPPPASRPTAAELAAVTNGTNMQATLAGRPASTCPYCGCTMFAYRTTTLKTRVERYEQCRNEKCGRKFVTKQLHAEIVREVGHDCEVSSTGKPQLTVHRESA